MVDLDDLRFDRWITWGPTGSALSDMHLPSRWWDRWLAYTLRSRGHEPVIAHTVCEHAPQLALIAAGLGVCVIPRLGRDPLPRGVRIVAVRPTLRRHVYPLWRTANTRRKSNRSDCRGISNFSVYDRGGAPANRDKGSWEADSEQKRQVEQVRTRGHTFQSMLVSSIPDSSQR